MKIELGGCTFGISEVPGGQGAFLSFQDTETQIFVVVPFATPNLSDLIRAIVQSGGMSEEQKRELAPLFNGGIFLPGEGFEKGPQG